MSGILVAAMTYVTDRNQAVFRAKFGEDGAGSESWLEVFGRDSRFTLRNLPLLRAALCRER